MKKLLIMMIALCVVLACTKEEETQFTGEGAVGIRLNWVKGGKGNHQTASPPQGLVEMEVEISGDGIDPAIVEKFSGTDLEDSSGVISGVPAGTNRTVIVRGKNDVDEIIAEGTESGVTISKNQTNVVSITITPKGSWILVDQENLSFGNVPTGIGEAIKSIYIENPGDQQLEITNFIFPEGFHTEEANPPIYINTDEIMEVKIVFEPTENKGYGGDLEIQSNAKNKPVFPISLSGTGTDEPYIDVMPNELNYGDVNIFEPPKIDSLFIENIGTEKLAIESVYFSSNAFFSNPEIPPVMELMPGESGKLDIFFAPETAGNYNDTLFIESNSYENDVFMISVNGVGKEGSMIVTEPEHEIDFGAHPVGEPSYPYDIMVYNVGDKELIINDLFFEGDSENFSTDFQTPSFIAKGDSLPLPIVFYPNAEQEYNCDFHIYSNAQNQPDKAIYLHGVGASGSFISVMPYFVHFGEVEIDTESDPMPIVIDNNGDEPLDITDLIFSAPDIFYSPDQPPIQIQPGNSQPIDVIFHPTEEMTYDETLTIIHNAANEINPISLDGTGIPPAIPEDRIKEVNCKK